MPEAPRSLFVYYRVPARLHDAARCAVAALQTQMRHEHPGLTARLMVRADEQADATVSTWMEVYEHPDGISLACEHRLAKLVEALQPGLIGSRHTEVFCPMAANTVGAV